MSNPSETPDPNQGKAFQFTGFVWLGAILCSLTFLLLVGFFIRSQYLSDLNHTRQELRSGAAVFSENIGLAFAGLETTLRTTGDMLLNHGRESPILSDYLSREQRILPFIRGLMILDPDGTVRLDSRIQPLSAQGMDLSDRPYFQTHPGNRKKALYIGHPLRSRVDNQVFLPVSKGVYDESQKLAAVVAASVEIDYFGRLFERINNGNGFSGILCHQDGTVLGVFPYVQGRAGKPLSNLASVRRMLKRDRGGVWETDKRITAVNALGPWPLMALLQTDKVHVQARFHRNLLIYLGLFLLLVCVVAFFAGSQIRQTRQLASQTLHLKQVGQDLEAANTRLKTEIAERKLAETRYRALFDNMSNGAGVFRTDNGADFIFVDWNKAAEQADGIEKAAVVGKNVAELFPGLEEMGLLPVFRRVFQTGAPEFLPLNRYQDDRIHTWRTNYVYKLPCGEIVSIFTDESAFHEQNERLAAIVKSSNDAIISKNLNEIIQTWNPGAQALYGYTAEEAIGQAVSLILPPDREKEPARFLEKIQKGGSIQGYETERLRKSGERIQVSLNISPIRDNCGRITGLSTIARDIGERLRMESQLRRVQKMEAIGTLASGIAHDFNNILFPIVGYTELAMDDIPRGSQAHENLKEVLNGAKRAGELVQHILAFGRSTEQERRPLKVQFVIKEALKLLRASMPSMIGIHQDIRTDCGPIMADPTQIHQIIMNLCTNAYHAMGGMESGGRLEVKLHELEIGPADIHGQLAPGRYLRLTVGDNGCGMDKVLVDRIFDPYFSTKGERGTGLGLAVVYGIVTGYGGEITVYSEPGTGTTFHLYFPRSLADAEEAPSAPEIVPQGKKEHILLVDDEPPIVAMEQLMLEGLGYTVKGHVHSPEALDYFREDPRAFDLVITDQAMPALSGAELAREIREIRPEIPIILCTGFSEIITEQMTREIGIRHCLMKPVLRGEMAKTVRQALDKN